MKGKVNSENARKAKTTEFNILKCLCQHNKFFLCEIVELYNVVLEID